MAEKNKGKSERVKVVGTVKTLSRFRRETDIERLFNECHFLKRSMVVLVGIHNGFFQAQE